MTFNYRADDTDFIDVNDKSAIAWLSKHYPAITATRPVGMSEGYKFMPSLTIARTLQDNFGMKMVSVGQQHSRMRDPKGQEHFMKFRMPESMIDFSNVGDSLPELVIMNSHNGRSVIKAYAGVFRMVCANGMVVSEESFGNIKLRHFGEQNSYEEFGKMLKVLARRVKVLAARISKMQGTMITRHDENQLAKLILEARKAPKWVTAKHALEVRRPEDDYDEEGVRDLWRTFNVIQENVTSQQLVLEPTKDERKRSVRPLTGARSDIITNERIWQALETFISKRAKKFPDLILPEIIEGEATEVEPEKAEA